MYTVRPYSQRDIVVPAEILYHVSSYHHQPLEGTSGEQKASTCDNDVNNFGSQVKNIQQDLLARLTSLQESLTKLNLNLKSPSTTTKKGQKGANGTELPYFTKRHVPILKLIVAYAKSRNFPVELTEDKRTNKVTLKYNGAANIDSSRVSSALDAFKWVGSVLGIFATDGHEADKWMKIFESEEVNVDFIRELSRRLAPQDFLCGIDLALDDIIARANFHDKNNYTLTNWKDATLPNNVQLWIKRVDETIGPIAFKK